MKLRTDKVFIVVIMMVMMAVGSLQCRAQEQINAVEIATLGDNGYLINKQIGAQTKEELANLPKVTIQAGEMNSIASWEKKFSKYLRDARSYAQQAKAAYGIYSQIIRVLINVVKLKKAVEYNPEGIVASGLMTETYIQVADEVVLSLYLLKEVFSKGGDNNMLNGKDRAQVWWDLNDTLERLNDNLYRMAYNIAYYDLVDVWRNATQGMLQRDKSTIARHAFERWRKVPEIGHILNK